MNEAGRTRLFERFVIHVADHQDVPCLSILNDSDNKSGRVPLQFQIRTEFRIVDGSILPFTVLSVSARVRSKETI